MLVDSAAVAAATVSALLELNVHSQFRDNVEEILIVLENITVCDTYTEQARAMSCARHMLRRVLALLDNIEDCSKVDKNSIVAEVPLAAMPQLESNPVWAIAASSRSSFASCVTDALRSLDALRRDVPVEMNCELWLWIRDFCLNLDYNLAS